jgi:hypothetical protein
MLIFILDLCDSGDFDSGQQSWLVIWEAGVVIQLPAGVFLLYPSSLFFHFNVDINLDGEYSNQIANLSLLTGPL